MKILVLGEQGQIARSLAEASSGHPHLTLKFMSRLEADLSLAGSVADTIGRAVPDVVINAAAFTDVDRAEDEPALAFRINAEGAGEAASAAHDGGAAFIQLSTDYVFDGAANTPYAEDAPTNPLSVYGRSKLAGEEAVRNANPNHLILRTAWVYSPFGRNFVKTMVAAAQDHDQLSVVDDQIGNPTSAHDLAEGILTMIGQWSSSGARIGLGETYHLAGSGSTSWRRVAEAIMEECSARGMPAARVKPIRTEDWPTKAARPKKSVLDCTKFERDFGYRMPEWQKSLPTVVARLVGQGT